MHGFSLGPRSCLGKNLALLESKIAVIKFMQRYEELKETHPREFVWKIANSLKHSTVTFKKKAEE